MRQTYTDLKNHWLDSIGQNGSSDANLIAFFKRSLSQRYQTALAELDIYLTRVPKTDSTEAATQYYKYPVGISRVVNATVTVGGIAYPLTVVDSQMEWDRINQTLIATTAIPQFIFPRRDDYGIYPIPQDVYTITLNQNYKDRDMTQEDYLTGTVTVTSNSTTLTGAGTTFTSAMVGRWFQLTPSGYWYRIGSFTSTTVLVLERKYTGATASGQAYRIGETPEFPEEGHVLLAYGCASDYFGGPRGNIQKATWFNNIFWTGDGQNSDRENRNIQGGILGMKSRYSSRSTSGLIKRNKMNDPVGNSKLWATTIS